MCKKESTTKLIDSLIAYAKRCVLAPDDGIRPMDTYEFLSGVIKDYKLQQRIEGLRDSGFKEAVIEVLKESEEDKNGL